MILEIRPLFLSASLRLVFSKRLRHVLPDKRAKLLERIICPSGDRTWLSLSLLVSMELSFVREVPSGPWYNFVCQNLMLKPLSMSFASTLSLAQYISL
ncbi:hypothetical protein Bxe_B0044 [Paraburkholderia xenovorans LB400]|uniref:Uncharacterized protein n=1 Tax=Paraburkholderia xenovorans (strain LB400) TaxID=266265 RepID=Q13J57_PARXL|nr:hypothetical protein Bxe_B0044 [Paraburkholderia xenovorans LB400]